MVNELGNEACLLRCISRKVFGNPEQHATIRANILQYIQEHLHDKLPNAKLSFHDAISFGIGIEPVQILNAPPTLYSSAQHYLELMVNPCANAGYIEIIAAQLAYNINISVSISGQPYPPPTNNTCNVLYFPSSMHYVSVHYNA